MKAHRSKYKIKVILSLSNINADFLQLILCMFVSHYVLQNPLYGAALFLFANIWLLYFNGGLRHLRSSNRRVSYMAWLLLALCAGAGLAIIFFYPIMMQQLQANYVSFFVLLITARSALTYRLNDVYKAPKLSNRIYKAVFQLLFLLPCIAFALWLFKGNDLYVVIGGYALTGFLMSFQGSTLSNFNKYVSKLNADKLSGISSYRIFSSTTLYSQIAFSLGMLMYICYISFTQDAFSWTTYFMMGMWVILVLAVSETFSWLAIRRRWVLSLNLFLVGAAAWIFASIKMFGATDIAGSAVWTVLWGFGLACINVVMNSLNEDFKMVAAIANKRVSDKELYYRTLLLQIIAVIISNVIMLCVLTIWTFGMPKVADAELPGLFRSVMIQLPVIFMLISVLFALRQPLDERNLQKLTNYFTKQDKEKPVKQNLKKKLVQKSRVRFGVKLIATFVRPFLRLKVSGKENMDFENFPSIFVCNHGLFYGPIAAVIYLPTYFRPWVDKKMVVLDLCAQEIYDRELYKWPVLSKKAKMAISRFVAKPVSWALNSFNPIPVEKTSLRGVVETFDDTVQVLIEGDNVLIFPEKPKRVKKKNKMTVAHERQTVGRLYTGFAGIGTLYYEKTGKQLKFYPIYANKKGHTFKIGEPVLFDPDNDPKEEKQRIAEELHYKMLDLKGDN